jgi:hypothetical protein
MTERPVNHEANRGSLPPLALRVHARVPAHSPTVPHLLDGVPLAEEGEGEKVLDDQAGGSEHGNAAVLDLSLASRRFPFFLSKGLPFLSLSLRVFPFSL